MTRRYTRITPEKEVEIKRLRYEERMPVDEIARVMGVARSNISAIAPTRTTATSERDQKVIDMLRDGRRQVDVCAAMNLSPERVSRVAQRARLQGLLNGDGGASHPPTAIADDDHGGGKPLSLKDRILRKVALDGPWETTDALMDACRNGAPKAYATHEFVHLLYSLQKQDLITFRQSRRPGLGSAGPTEIVATKRGIDAVTLAVHATEAASASTVTATDSLATDVTQEAIAAPGPSTGRVEGSDGGDSAGWEMPTEMAAKMAEWPALVARTQSVAAEAVTKHKAAIDAVPVPLLRALAVREAERETNKAKAQRFLEAAALLADVDKDTSDALLDRASTLEGQPFSPLEAEYLSFAHAVDSSFTTLRDTIDTL